jgi:hypothetical protein
MGDTQIDLLESPPAMILDMLSCLCAILRSVGAIAMDKRAYRFMDNNSVRVPMC